MWLIGQDHRLLWGPQFESAGSGSSALGKVHVPIIIAYSIVPLKGLKAVGPLVACFKQLALVVVRHINPTIQLFIHDWLNFTLMNFEYMRVYLVHVLTKQLHVWTFTWYASLIEFNKKRWRRENRCCFGSEKAWTRRLTVPSWPPWARNTTHRSLTRNGWTWRLSRTSPESRESARSVIAPSVVQ